MPSLWRRDRMRQLPPAAAHLSAVPGGGAASPSGQPWSAEAHGSGLDGRAEGCSQESRSGGRGAVGGGMWAALAGAGPQTVCGP